MSSGLDYSMYRLEDIQNSLRVELVKACEGMLQLEEKKQNRPPVEITLPKTEKVLLFSPEAAAEALNVTLPKVLYSPVWNEPQKSCDYVIVRELEEGLQVLLVELKGKYREEAEHQIAMTRLWVDWMLDSVAYKAGWFERRARQYRAVIFKTNAERPRGTLLYKQGMKMTDLSITTYPYGKCYLEKFWKNPPHTG